MVLCRWLGLVHLLTCKRHAGTQKKNIEHVVPELCYYFVTTGIREIITRQAICLKTLALTQKRQMKSTAR